MHTMTLYTVMPGGAVYCCARCGFSVAYWHAPWRKLVMDAGAPGVSHAAAGRLLWEAARV